MPESRDRDLKQLLELLAKPLFIWRMASHNGRKGAPLASQRALDTIEMLIFAWAKKRWPEGLPEISNPMDEGVTFDELVERS